ncbi:MAG: hypothetical protein SFV51_07025 [Bryobacteraceae bacterium]|nr:hypothetical protein [Bryobacteraceae bacterium]
MAEDNTQSKEAPKGNVDEVALELMKFIALTTGFGKPGSSAAGFAGKPAKSGAEEYADALLSLYTRCRDVVKSGG